MVSPLQGDLSGLTATAAYIVVFGFVFAECGLLLGFFLPGDTVLFAAGLLAHRPGSGLQVVVVAVGVVLAAVTGEALGYAVGRRAGRRVLLRRGSRFGPATLARAEAFYARYGWWALIAARFIPWVRTLAPILAGAARMPYAAFAAANVVGALVWGGGLVVIGYIAADVPVVRHLSVGIAVVAVVAGAVESTRRWRSAARRPAGSGAEAERDAGSPAPPDGRRVSPAADENHPRCR